MPLILCVFLCYFVDYDLSINPSFIFILSDISQENSHPRNRSYHYDIAALFLLRFLQDALHILYNVLFIKIHPRKREKIF